MNRLIGRNLKIFFRDRASVFFSLLSSLIIIGLFVLFLGDVWSSDLGDVPNAREIMDNWIMAGLLAVTSLTTTMGAFWDNDRDRERKIIKDFYSSPLSRGSIVRGYIISAFVIGVIMTMIVFLWPRYISYRAAVLLSHSRFCSRYSE
jgi:multidrug/hemolysin transport system permease protein